MLITSMSNEVKSSFPARQSYRLVQQFIRLHGAQVSINTACIIKRVSLLHRCCSLKKRDLCIVLFSALILFLKNILSLFLLLLIVPCCVTLYPCFFPMSTFFQLTSVILKQTLPILLYRCKTENWSKVENMCRALFSLNLCAIALNIWYTLV